MTAHMNRLKAWNSPDASILRVVLADEVVEVEGKDEETLLEPQQSADVAQLLDEYSDRLNVSFGEGISLEHVINTEAHNPVWTSHHWIAPAWREPLKDEVRLWLEQGIIGLSNSPWSSPANPVRKPNGSLRLCVGY